MKEYVIIANVDDTCELVNVLLSREKKLQKKKKLSFYEQFELLKLEMFNKNLKTQIQLQNQGKLKFKIREVNEEEENKEEKNVQSARHF